LYESLTATFERIKRIFGIFLEPSLSNLRKIQNKEIDFGNKTSVISEAFSSHLQSYNDNWDKINKMLENILSEHFRKEILDSFGGGWIYNWFCLDHVGYEYNPRKRDMGYHNIYDYYQEALQRYLSSQDEVHWHFHPMPIYKEAHKNATSYVNSPHLYQVLCRKIIERQTFPAAVRAGFQAERPDSHLFFEQWIPFDFTNWAFHSADHLLQSHLDIRNGRSGDWRLAPDDWSVYQPSIDSWQIPGNCKRWIARCIDINMRGRELTQEEVEKAFHRAHTGKPTLLAFNNHDFRDMCPEINSVREKIKIASQKFPDVQFKFSGAVNAFKNVVYGPEFSGEKLELNTTLENVSNELILKVETKKGKVFGPQPFLSVKTKSGRFIHDNFNFDPSLTRWYYIFDENAIHSNDIDTIGVASNDSYGNTFVKTITL